MRTILLISICFSCFKCGRAANNFSDTIVTENIVAYMADTIPAVSLPFGDKRFFYNFPPSWEYGVGEESINSKMLDSLSCFYSPIDKFNGIEFDFPESFFTRYDNTSLFHVFTKDSLLIKESYRMCQKIEMASFTLVLLHKRDELKGAIQENGYAYSRIDALLLDLNGNFTDGLNIQYSATSSYSYSIRHFFIDEEGIIHLKDFFIDELRTSFFRHEKYQISPQGKFICYYDQNGMFSNNDERGLVKNHTREGRWIEMRSNGYIDFRSNLDFRDDCTYLEAEYKDGLPIGEWKFYKLEQEYSEEDGKPIFSTRKKGKLLYTETYKDGELVKREFVR